MSDKTCRMCWRPIPPVWIYCVPCGEKAAALVERLAECRHDDPEEEVDMLMALRDEARGMLRNATGRSVTCCGREHRITQWTDAGPNQYGAECGVCGSRMTAENPAALQAAFRDAASKK